MHSRDIWARGRIEVSCYIPIVCPHIRSHKCLALLLRICCNLLCCLRCLLLDPRPSAALSLCGLPKGLAGGLCVCCRHDVGLGCSGCRHQLTILDYSLPELKVRCKGANCSVEGVKPDLQARLLQKLAPLASQPSTLGSTATAQLPGLQEAVAAALEPLRAQLQGFADLRAQVDQGAAQIVALRAEKRELYQLLGGFQYQVSSLECSIPALQAAASQAGDAEAHTGRRPNLVVAKLGAGSQAEAGALVPKLLDTMGVTCKPTSVQMLPSHSYIYAARAAPGLQGGSPGAARAGVFQAASTLQGTSFSQVRLDDALTPAQMQIRRARQPHFQKLWENKQRPRWRGVEIVVAGRVWRPAAQTLRPPSAAAAAVASAAASVAATSATAAAHESAPATAATTSAQAAHAPPALPTSDPYAALALGCEGPAESSVAL